MPKFWNPIEVDGATIASIRGWRSQAWLAEQLGIARRTVIRWERDGAKFDRWAMRYSGRSAYPKLLELAKEKKIKLPKVGK